MRIIVIRAGGVRLKYESFEKRSVGLASILICIFFGFAVLYFFLKYGFGILLPFIISWGVALTIVPVALKLTGGNEKRSKIVSVILLFILLFLVVMLFAVAFDRLIYEVHRLMDRLSEDSENISELVGKALDFVESITDSLPFLDRLVGGEELTGLRERIDSLVGDVISGFVTHLSTKIPLWLGKLIAAFPSFILFVIVTLISSFYFCLDLGGVHRGIKSVLPLWASKKLASLRRRATGTAVKYLRAYVLLLFMTFVELLVGFSILKVDYAFLLAALIAVIDFLPIFGVGSVLVPWAIVLLLSGNYYLGVGLLIVYGCTAVVRQVAEPKIVGGSLGIHPLLTLVSMYAGFKLFGFFGMILGPAAALAVKSIFFAPKNETSELRP